MISRVMKPCQFKKDTYQNIYAINAIMSGMLLCLEFATYKPEVFGVGSDNIDKTTYSNSASS